VQKTQMKLKMSLRTHQTRGPYHKEFHYSFHYSILSVKLVRQ